MPVTDAPIIDVRNLSFRFGSELVLENINFQVQRGEFVGLIGPNGSGKTTLLKLILGLLSPQEGSVKLFDQSMTLGKNASKIGYIPQKMSQSEGRFPITVEEVIGLGQPVGKPSRRSVENALETVGLSDFRHRLITDLSGGQQQRAFIAKALVSLPELLILDEPTVGIDAPSEENFYALLDKLNRERRLTIIIVSHDIDVVMSQIDSVLCLNKNVVYHGDPQNFVKGEYLEKLYGKNRRFVIHEHHEH